MKPSSASVLGDSRGAWERRWHLSRQCWWLLHVGSHSSHVVEHSGYGAHDLVCEHQPQPSSSEQAQAVFAIEHVSMQCRRQDARHVLCDDGHSRHVVVHLSAGSHVSVDEHQPQPGESSWQPHTSVAAAHTSDEDTLTTSFACAVAASSSESACSLRRIMNVQTLLCCGETGIPTYSTSADKAQIWSVGGADGRRRAASWGAFADALVRMLSDRFAASPDPM